MININLLKELYKINSKSGKEEKIINFIINYLTNNLKLNPVVDSYGNIFVVKGKCSSYPCIVCHTDQVGDYEGNITIIRSKNQICGFGEDGNQVNIGADDKNGVWITLELLKTEPFLKAAFFVEEESGCQGSYSCDLNFFRNIKYILQCDRKGSKDFIQETFSTELCPVNFISPQLLAKYNYQLGFGYMTDVEALKIRGIKVACCNMSCGYYEPHTDKEYTKIDELINCLKFVREIIKTIPLTKHKYESKNFYSNMDRFYYFGYNRYYDWELIDY